MLFVQERSVNRQIGYTANSGSGYIESGSDLSFAVGQYVLIRMKSAIPRAATINSAVLRLNIVAGNPATAQTATLVTQAHTVGDSPPLVPGVAEAARPKTNSSATTSISWPANANAGGEVYVDANVQPMLQEVVNRSDYFAGASITFIIYCQAESSDLRVRANNAFFPSPQLIADYKANRVDDVYVDVNLAHNPNLVNDTALGAGELPGWDQNSFFNMMVSAAPNLGTITRDTTFTRLSGIPTLKFTTGTPPTTDTGRSTGPMMKMVRQTELPYIFSGWVYIPAAITSNVYAGDPFQGPTLSLVTARDTWVPFCSAPTTPGAVGVGNFYPAMAIRGPWPAGASIWISEPTVMASDCKKMPFNYGTPDAVDPGGSVLIDYYGSGQTSIKRWTPRTCVVRNGVQYRVPRYEMRADGILQNAEPIKGGPRVTDLSSSLTADGFPAGKTFAEL